MNAYVAFYKQETPIFMMLICLMPRDGGNRET